jgi:16S rRNA (cytosine967-C5)-methyltransferase
VLVYTTCSFEPEETTEVLAAALPEDFEPDPLGPVLQRAGILLSAGNHVLELRPSTHGTDGFFMARFRRRG